MALRKQRHFYLFAKRARFLMVTIKKGRPKNLFPPVSLSLEERQPRSQGSLLLVLSRSVGRVGENPGNEAGGESTTRATPKLVFLRDRHRHRHLILCGTYP